MGSFTQLQIIIRVQVIDAKDYVKEAEMARRASKVWVG